MKKTLIILFAFAFFALNSNAEDTYYSNRIVFKTKTIQSIDKTSNVLLSADVSDILNVAAITSITAPYAKHYSKYGGRLQANSNGLERICEVVFAEGVNVDSLCEVLAKNPDIEYAERVPIYKLLDYIPNDPSLQQQWHLQDLGIYKAWEVAKDKTGVVVGVVDSGVDFIHLDLFGNSYTNPNEIEDGIDNDHNGFIDDIRGWDFIGNIDYEQAYYGKFKPDNDVTPLNSDNSHGTHVAGLIAAVANNGRNGAGTGINAKFIATKHAQDIGAGTSIFEGFKGIMYCAEMGAKIINCSWGGHQYSKANEEVVKEVVDKGIMLCIAAGNDDANNTLTGNYPANYPGVFSIGASASNGLASTFSNFGYNVGLFSPGTDIYSTLPRNNFGRMSGTSMATPILSGVAALVMSVFPDYTPIQVYHQLRSTSVRLKDNSLMKYGKINAYNAVTYNNSDFPDKIVPGVGVSDFSLPPFNSFSSYGKKQLTLDFTNYIGSASNLSVKLTSLDGMVTITSPETNLGEMEKMQTKSNTYNVQLNSKAAISAGKAQILVEYTDGTFTDFEVIYIPINISTPILTLISTLNSAGDGDSDAKPIDMHYFGDNMAAVICNVQMMNYYLPVVYIANESSSISPSAYQQSQFTTRASRSIYAFGAQSVQYATDAKIYPMSAVASAIVTISTNSSLTDWKEIDVTSMVHRITKLHYFDATNGILLGDTLGTKWGIGVTKNKGETWSAISNIQAPVAGESALINDRGVMATTNNSIWFATNKGRIFYSDDKGYVWKVNNDLAGFNIVSIAFADTNNGMSILYKDNVCYIAKTHNGGVDWSYSEYMNVNANADIAPAYIHAVNPTQYVIVAYNNAMWATNDTGKTFKNANTKLAFNCNTFAGRNTVMAGNNNSIRIKSIGYSNQYNSSNIVDYRPYGSIITTVINEPFFDITRSVSLQPPSMLNFGSIELGKDSIREIEMTNTGESSLNFSEYTIIPDNDSTTTEDFKILSYASTIKIGATGKIQVRFQPKSKGNKVATLWIANNSDKYPELAFKLIGNGLFTEFAELQLDRQEVEFDTTFINVDNHLNYRNVVITNVGNTNVILDSIAIIPQNTTTSADDFSIGQNVTLPNTILPNEKQTIPIIFEPKTKGDKNANFVLHNSGITEINIIATGVGDEPMGIVEQNYNIFAPITPNPTKDNCHTTIYLDNQQYYTIELLNVLGESYGIVAEGYGSGEVDVDIKTSFLPAGSYILVLQANGKKYINSFVINQ
ncbi:MAG: S8 family serine peptidase [Ignavibacteria bacterium]|jgi:subtilisin family serine protease|nr:S8 family serine peptidase [Ignavibacteria bacterium]